VTRWLAETTSSNTRGTSPGVALGRLPSDESLVELSDERTHGLIRCTRFGHAAVHLSLDAREHSPLQAAPDAHTVDTTRLTLPRVVARIVALGKARR
jgi:hypothetical protein